MTRIAIGLVGLAAIIGVVFWALHADRTGPLQRPVVTVEDRSVSMGYLVSRSAIEDREPIAMLDTLVREALLVELATDPPFDIAAEEAQVSAYLSRWAGRDLGPASDDQYEVWEARFLNDTMMSEDELRALALARLVREAMLERLAAALPQSVPQVRLSVISTQTLADADRLRAMLEEGADFAELARQYADDPILRENGGDVGWMAREALPPALAEAVFDDLAPADVSAPLARIDVPGFILARVEERVAGRALDEEARLAIASRQLDDLIDEAYARYRVVVSGLENGYDSQTEAWVREQVAQRREAMVR